MASIQRFTTASCCSWVPAGGVTGGGVADGWSGCVAGGGAGGCTAGCWAGCGCWDGGCCGTRDAGGGDCGADC
ncbi:hypothetical protein FWK35_00026025 [Aphis craccivora]|uniref:Uncharacterized protein n=1 Tax=Aphis craccivora TaxID=307492 RepID=A0A6G0VP82_APHCR|nr:hypothetical protein FWK35_00028351 [Aphis craccivora]KAF0736153.1 hypothetical protein FWK35_00026025 [Aphis craccivora]